MNKIFTTIILGALTLCVKAQTPATAPTTQLFGKIDKADLEMKTCDFEKDANAEVLFAKHDIYYGADLLSITDEIHRRIKILMTTENRRPISGYLITAAINMNILPAYKPKPLTW